MVSEKTQFLHHMLPFLAYVQSIILAKNVMHIFVKMFAFSYSK